MRAGPIDNLELAASNIGLVLSDRSSRKQVPIGLEVSGYDDLLQAKTIRLQIKHGTLVETKLEKFSIERGATRFAVRQLISMAPAIRTLLTQHNVVTEVQSFMSRDFVPLGREYGLEASNISVCAVLNQIVRESQTKYWIVLRHGKKKQYFVVNL